MINTSMLCKYIHEEKTIEHNIGYKFSKICFIEIKCLNRQSTAMSLTIIVKNLTLWKTVYCKDIFFFSDVQFFTVKMEKLSSHIQMFPVKKQYIIQGRYQYLKFKKMHYPFTWVYHKSPTAEQERPFHIDIYMHKMIA